MRDLPALPPGYPLHLGEPQTVFRQGNVCRLRYAARFLVWLAVAVAYTLLFGLLFRRTSTGGAWVLGVIGLIFIAAGSFYVLRKEWRCVAQWQHVAVLFRDGFGYFDGERWRSFAWNEIAEVTVWVKPPSWDWFSGGEAASVVLTPLFAFLQGYSCRYEVSAPGDKLVYIGQTLTGSEDLMGTIQGKTFDSRLKRALRAFDDGEEVHFGPLVMQRARGIGCGGPWYPWEKVGHLSYPDEKDSPLKITPVAGHWFESMSVPWREIANADLVHSVSAHGLKMTGRYKSFFAPAHA